MTLALSKIKAHKKWFIFVIVSESILLEIAFLAFGVSRAVTNDLIEYSTNSLSGKYYVRVTSPEYSTSSQLNNNTEIWDLSEKLYNEGEAYKKSVASKYGLNYTYNTDEKPTSVIEGEKEFNSWTTYARKAIYQYLDTLDFKNGYENLKEMLAPYDPKEIYAWHNLIADGSIIPIINGKEDFSKYRTATSSEQESMFSGSQVLDEVIYSDFITDSYNLDDDTIPIVLSVDSAQKYLESENNGDFSDAGYENIKENISGKVIEACYRNDASKELIFLAQQTHSPNEQTITYNLPNGICGAATIKSDTRTTEEKTSAKQYEAYLGEIGESKTPIETMLRFKVIGVIPTENSYESTETSIQELVKRLANITISTPLIPKAYYEHNQEKLGTVLIDYSKEKDYFGLASGFLVEFYDAETAQKFVDENNCLKSNPDCYGLNSPFRLTFENKSLLLTDITRTAQKVIVAGSVAVVAIAIITTLITIIRLTAQDRKQISIYKAIGFNNSDISRIYLYQTLITTLAIIITAFIISTVVGQILNFAFNDTLARALKEYFLINNKEISTTVYTLNFSPILLIGSVTLLSTIVASALASLSVSKTNIVTGLRYE